MPTDPEAQGYLLILAGTVLILIGALAVASWSATRARRARRRANRLLNDLDHADDLVADLRRAVAIADARLDFHRRYPGASVNEHFDQTYPRWTRPGPAADATVILPAAAHTAVLSTVPPVDEAPILTTTGASLLEPT